MHQTGILLPHTPNEALYKCDGFGMVPVVELINDRIRVLVPEDELFDDVHPKQFTKDNAPLLGTFPPFLIHARTSTGAPLPLSSFVVPRT